MKSKGCYAKGGATRKIGGITAPRYGENDKVMNMAKSTKSEGKVGMAGIGANGAPAKSSPDKASRKMKRGY